MKTTKNLTEQLEAMVKAQEEIAAKITAMKVEQATELAAEKAAHTLAVMKDAVTSVLEAGHTTPEDFRRAMLETMAIWNPTAKSSEGKVKTKARKGSKIGWTVAYVQAATDGVELERLLADFAEAHPDRDADAMKRLVRTQIAAVDGFVRSGNTIRWVEPVTEA